CVQTPIRVRSSLPEPLKFSRRLIPFPLPTQNIAQMFVHAFGVYWDCLQSKRLARKFIDAGFLCAGGQKAVAGCDSTHIRRERFGVVEKVSRFKTCIFPHPLLRGLNLIFKRRARQALAWLG